MQCISGMIEAVYRWPCGCQHRAKWADSVMSCGDSFTLSTPCPRHDECVADEDALKLDFYEFCRACGLSPSEATVTYSKEEW
jgi:hypothetical protein